jgi:chloramphenicol-sensitive protein RarD
MIGVLVYREPFGRERLLGFGLIWTALLLYSIEGVWRSRRAKREAAGGSRRPGEAA